MQLSINNSLIEMQHIIKNDITFNDLVELFDIDVPAINSWDCCIHSTHFQQLYKQHMTKYSLKITYKLTFSEY